MFTCSPAASSSVSSVVAIVHLISAIIAPLPHLNTLCHRAVFVDGGWCSTEAFISMASCIALSCSYAIVTYTTYIFVRDKRSRTSYSNRSTTWLNIAGLVVGCGMSAIYLAYDLFGPYKVSLMR